MRWAIPALLFLTYRLRVRGVVVISSLGHVWLFCNLMDYSPPISSFPGISQAGILEWVAIPTPWESSQPRDQTCIFCIAGRFFTSVVKTPGKIIHRFQRCSQESYNLSDVIHSKYTMEPGGSSPKPMKSGWIKDFCDYYLSFWEWNNIILGPERS